MAALSGVVLLGLITRELVTQAWPAMQEFGLGFLTTQAWDPNKQLFGAATFIFGTVVTSFGALLLATPISIAIALFLSELAPRGVRTVVGVLVDMLAAIPSVVLGLWGILVLGPFIVNTLGPALHNKLGFLPIFSTEPTVGSSMFAAILVLTIMIVPIVSSICRELFLGVPTELKDGALALGATRWEVDPRGHLSLCPRRDRRRVDPRARARGRGGDRGDAGDRQQRRHQPVAVRAR